MAAFNLNIATDGTALATFLTINVHEANDYKKEGILFIDVRESNELIENGAYPEAVHIPKDTLSLQTLPDDMNTTIIFACHSGGRSAMASRTAIDLGYRNILNMDGGILGWKEAGLPYV